MITINTTSIVNDNLAKSFPNIKFEEPDDSEFKCDIDYIGKVGSKAFGIQIRHLTANSNFGNYKPSERMQADFNDFEEKYGGGVFIVFSTKVGNKKEIQNKNVIMEISKEIERLTAQQ